MADIMTATLTGTFKDPLNRPLHGYIRVQPAPKYVGYPEIDTMFSSPVDIRLDDTGSVNAELIVTNGWRYKIVFSELRNPDNQQARIESVVVPLTETNSIADLIGEEYPEYVAPEPGLIILDSTNVGEIGISGAVPDPNDPGAILLPVSR